MFKKVKEVKFVENRSLLNPIDHLISFQKPGESVVI